MSLTRPDPRRPPLAHRALRFGAAGLGVAAGLSCGPPPAVVDIAAVTAQTAEPAAAPAAEPAARSGPGCSWTARFLDGRDDHLPLCFATDRACFARVLSPFFGDATVTLPEGMPASTGAHLHLRADGVVLDAWTGGHEPLLYPVRPLVFGGIAIPENGATLRVKHVGAGRRLELALEDASVRPLRGTLRARATCDDLGLATGGFSPDTIRAAMGITGASLGRRTLATDQPVPISATADGPPLAEVTPQEADAMDVELLEQRSRRSRISWHQAGMTLVGWVDAAAVGPPPSRAPAGYGVGGGRALPPPRPGTRCPADTQLFAEVHDAWEQVGIIEKETRFDVIQQTDGWATVTLRARYLQLEPSSKWLVPAQALADCAFE